RRAGGGVQHPHRYQPAGPGAVRRRLVRDRHPAQGLLPPGPLLRAAGGADDGPRTPEPPGVRLVPPYIVTGDCWVRSTLADMTVSQPMNLAQVKTVRLSVLSDMVDRPAWLESTMSQAAGILRRKAPL